MRRLCRLSPYVSAQAWSSSSVGGPVASCFDQPSSSHSGGQVVESSTSLRASGLSACQRRAVSPSMPHRHALGLGAPWPVFAWLRLDRAYASASACSRAEASSMSSAKASAPASSEVHVELQECFSWQALADAVDKHADQIDMVALAVAAEKVVQFDRDSRPGGSRRSSPNRSAAVDPEPSGSGELAEHQRALLAKLGLMFMRLLPQPHQADAPLAVQVLHSFAVLRVNPAGDARGLLELCRLLREGVLPALQPQSPDHLIDMLWSVGRLCSTERVQLEEQVLGSRAVDPALFSQVAGVLYPRISSLQSRYLSKLMHAFTMGGIYYYPLLLGIINASKMKLGEFESPSLTNLIRCLSKLDSPDDSFFRLVAERLRLGMRQLPSHQVVSLVHSFAMVKYDDAEFYDAASQKLQLTMSLLDATQLMQVAWAYAVRKLPDIRLYNAIAFRATPIVSELKPYELSMLVWAFARQGLHQRHLLDVCGKEAARRIDGFSMKNMANLAWAMANLNHPSPQLFEAIADRAALMLADAEGRSLVPRDDGVEEFLDLAGRRVERFPSQGTERVHLRDGTQLTRPIVRQQQYVPQNLADLAWAYSALGHKDERLFRLLAHRTLQDLPSFSKTSLVDLACGFAAAKHLDQELFRGIEDASLMLLPDFGPAYLGELLWSMATVEYKPREEFIAAAMDVTWNKWERVTSDRKWLAKTIWALLKLEVDKVMPTHPLLSAFNSALGELDAHEASLISGRAALQRLDSNGNGRP